MNAKNIVLLITLFILGVQSLCLGYELSISCPDSNVTTAQDQLFSFLNETRINTSIYPKLTQKVCTWFGCFDKQMERLPLARSSRLDQLATRLSHEVAKGRYFSDNQKAFSISSFLEENDFSANNATLFVSAIMLNSFKDPCEAANIFARDISNKIDAMENGDAQEELPFLDPHFLAAGIALTPVLFQLNDFKQVPGYILTVILVDSANLNTDDKIQCGHVFIDLNGNDIYNESEGLTDIFIFDSESTDIVLGKTYDSGRYCIIMKRGGDLTLKAQTNEPSFSFIKGCTQGQNGILYCNIKIASRNI